MDAAAFCGCRIADIAPPAIDWAIARTRLPRPIFVFLVFALFLLLATLVAYLGIPPLAREMTHVFNDFETIVRELAQRMIGSGKISLLGQPMDAGQLATTVGNGLRNWFAQTGVLATLGAAVLGTMFGVLLTLVLLFYFLLDGPSMARGLLQLVPPRQRPLIAHIWTVLIQCSSAISSVFSLSSPMRLRRRMSA